MSNPAWKMYVFRDGKYEIAGAELLLRLQEPLCRARCAPEAEFEDALLAALIAAGELECAQLDAVATETGPANERISEITDELARAFLTGRRDSLPRILQSSEQLHVEGRYRATVQEGFAYYALHPRKLAMLLDSLLAQQALPDARERGVRVLGIRSIGLTLSAVACAALQLRGIRCRRTSVRPAGHPYDRKLEVSPRLRQWIGERDGECLIVDEGPGISGSSFLAVAEAVEACGVSSSRIHMIGSRQVVDAPTLLAPNAAQRWPRYRFHALPAAPLIPEKAGEALPPGAWQSSFDSRDGLPSGSWTALEPARYLARDRQSTFCFAGFGHYGEEVCAHARLAAEAGFAPAYLGACRGFRQSAVTAGQTLKAGVCTPELLARMAAYMAFRSNSCTTSATQSPELETMLRWNWQIEFGAELGSAEGELRPSRVAVCDSQMMPAQWLRSPEGQLLKLDAGNYGDNHFFPGPCDIAWDLAGCVVEWELRGEGRDYLIAAYTRRSGDEIADRLDPYLLAYCTFRMAHARMAAAAMQGAADEPLLQRDYLRYRAQALRLRAAHRPSAARECGEILLPPGLQPAKPASTSQIPHSE